TPKRGGACGGSVDERGATSVVSMARLLIATTVPDTLCAFLTPFAAHFPAAGWRVDAMARRISSSDACLHAFYRVLEMPWSRNPLHPQNLFPTPARVREIVTRERYDIVHVHTPVAAFVTRLALRHLRHAGGPRVVYTAHGFHFYEGGPRLRGAVYRMLEQW